MDPADRVVGGVGLNMVTDQSSLSKSPSSSCLLLRFAMFFGNIVFFPSFFFFPNLVSSSATADRRPDS